MSAGALLFPSSTVSLAGLDQSFQFSGVAPMDNLEAQIRAGFGSLGVADFAEQ